MSSLLDLTIAEARAVLARREASSVEYVSESIRRIEETEPHLHAFATLMVETALNAARDADRELARGLSRGPLHGLPVAVKDLCGTADAPTEAGSEVLKGFIPADDAHVVHRLKAGGAVIVGKTVTSEFAFGPTSKPTKNPWNPEFTPSGSSAGSAVAVASRSVMGAIGTDTAGSIRSPAGVNAVVGLKPTFGLVGRSGVIPMSSTLDHVGPITGTVADCADMLSVIAGFDERDPGSRQVEAATAPLGHAERLDGLRVGLELKHLPDPLLDASALDPARGAAQALAELGATIVDIAIPELELADGALVAIMAAETASEHLDRFWSAAARYRQPSRLFVEAGALVPAIQYLKARRVRQLVGRAVRQAFRDHRLDGLIGPAWGLPWPAEELTDPFLYPMRPSVVNLIGIPAMNVPCGFTADGLPLGGFELWGRPWDEPTVFRIAHAYESAHDWWERRPPPPSSPG